MELKHTSLPRAHTAIHLELSGMLLGTEGLPGGFGGRLKGFARRTEDQNGFAQALESDSCQRPPQSRHSSSLGPSQIRQVVDWFGR